jgi:2-polyprenyl-6-methoxyphenol hydroxylase-like FAD-dependent oxidoreductase
MTDKKFAIVGGGIGGLTLAIALQKKGFQVTVYENASEIKPLGAGLALAANAVKALAEIGISDEVLKAGKVLKYLRIKDTRGKILSETNSEAISRKFGIVNNFTIHRADLHRVLISLLNPGTLKLGKGCLDFTTDSSGVTLQFDDGTTAHADCLIACDGIHSAIRKKLIPTSYPRYAGYTCWRAVVDPAPSNVDMAETSETWGPGCRFGIVPLSDNRLYWFACINAKEKDPAMRAMRVPDLQQHFKNFYAPVGDILAQTQDHKLIWSDIADIKPIHQFAFGKVVLLGDAAHATTPNMGQGACMAIEDAAILANCIENYSTPEETFIQYEKKRIERTTTIVNNSWKIGRVAQLENSLLIGLRNALIRATPVSFAEKQLKFITDVSFL